MYFCLLGEYDQNQCNASNPSCVPCTSRLHSCKGLPDGNNPIPGGHWIPSYIVCYKNRTIANKHCQKGNFDPATRVCTSKIDQSTFSLSFLKLFIKINLEYEGYSFYNVNAIEIYIDLSQVNV